MTTWQPQEAGLVQLCNLFAVSQKGENQAQILQQLEQYRQYPDFNNYLAYIFATAEQVPLEVRQSAGLYLKNSLRLKYADTDAQLKDYIKAALVPLLCHPEKALRHTAGSNISAMVVASGLGAWPQLVGVLQQALSSADMAAVDGGLDTLYKIVEESPIQMEATVPADGSSGAPGEPTTSASGRLVPPLLKLLQTATVGDVRRQAVAVLNLMARDMPGGIAQNLDVYLHSLFALAHDSVPGVRVEVVRGMVQLLLVQPDKLQPFLYQVVEYMLQCNEATDAGIALESCEFWRSFCEARLESDLLRPFLPRLIPMLMKNMVFEEHDEEVQEAQEAEAAGPRAERASELKPVHHKQAAQHGGADRDGEEEDSDDDDDEALSRWNLRRCSAAGLDRLSVVFGDELLPVLMPIVERRLQEPDWRARESAILGLGAVAEGCHMGLLPYLGGMTDMLLPMLADPQPMVRIISCWALSRYSYWLLAGAQEALAAQQQQAAGAAVPAPPPDSNLLTQLGRVIQGVLTAALDRNKFVQDSACSTVASLCQTAAQEDAAHMLMPHLPNLIQVLSTAVKQYGKRNIHLACDALCMLGEAAGPAMRDAALATTFMVPVCERMGACGPHDRELTPLFECAVMACGCLGPDIATWAPAIFQAALRVVVEQTAARTADTAYEAGLHSLALDVIDSLCEALGAGIEPLIAGTPLVQLLVAACQDPDPDVRQSGFALAGDLAKAAISVLLPAIPQLTQAAVQALEPHVIKKDAMRSCNNACWSLGELAIKLSPELVLPWATGAAERMAGLLVAGTSQLPASLIENAAITLGRVSWRSPDALAPHLGAFCVPWFQALRNVRDDVEKEQAFHGLCALLARHPDPVLAPGPPFGALAVAITSWRNMRSAALQQELKQLMAGLQSRMVAAGSWAQAMASLDPAVAQKLAVVCSA